MIMKILLIFTFQIALFGQFAHSVEDGTSSEYFPRGNPDYKFASCLEKFLWSKAWPSNMIARKDRHLKCSGLSSNIKKTEIKGTDNGDIHAHGFSSELEGIIFNENYEGLKSYLKTYIKNTPNYWKSDVFIHKSIHILIFLGNLPMLKLMVDSGIRVYSTQSFFKEFVATGNVPPYDYIFGDPLLIAKDQNNYEMFKYLYEELKLIRTLHFSKYVEKIKGDEQKKMLKLIKRDLPELTSYFPHHCKAIKEKVYTRHPQRNRVNPMHDFADSIRARAKISK